MTEVYIGVGSNVDREQNIVSIVGELERMFGALSVSSVYESAAVGDACGRYYNLVIGFTTRMAVDQLRALLKQMETRYGRIQHGPSRGSLPLDLDLLLYGDLAGELGGIRLPRGDVKQFAFVLCPLAEIAGMRCDPDSGESYQRLWSRFDKSRQPLTRVEMLLVSVSDQRSSASDG